MYLPTFFLLLLLLLHLQLTTAVPFLVNPDVLPTSCRPGHTPIDKILPMAYALQNRREYCCVKDFCAPTARNKGALILLCTKTSEELCIRCEKVGMAVMQAVAHCHRDGKVDGRVVFRETGLEVAVSAF
jgi:hypothetical protein